MKKLVVIVMLATLAFTQISSATDIVGTFSQDSVATKIQATDNQLSPYSAPALLLYTFTLVAVFSIGFATGLQDAMNQDIPYSVDLLPHDPTDFSQFDNVQLAN